MKKVFNRLCALSLLLILTASSAWAEGIAFADWSTALESYITQIGTRQSFTEGESRARDYLILQFEAMGYQLRDGTLQAQWMSAPLGAIRRLGWTGGMTNLIAVKKATGASPALLIVSAHYDSVSTTVGAKDNGSGVAALLTLAKAFAQREAFPDTEIRFVAFASEEKGELGSGFFSMELTPDQRERLIGVLNIDLITLDEGTENMALCCNTLGGGTAEGYREGTEEEPAHNRISMAFEKAFWEVGGYHAADRNVSFYIPRHVGDSDHVRFHQIGVDAANICFQGNDAIGGAWAADMHTWEDMLKPYDQARTQQALDTIYRTVLGLASDHWYGQR
ncbi:MAG: M28 family peptidase [Eubacteriales bacterium]|nr:M28 family peptidase [Eubacteriales bacterium]